MYSMAMGRVSSFGRCPNEPQANLPRPTVPLSMALTFKLVTKFGTYSGNVGGHVIFALSRQNNNKKHNYCQP